MVQRASVKGIPQNVLDNFPEVYGTAPVDGEITGSVDALSNGLPLEVKTAVTRKPLTEVEEVLETGLQLFVE